MELRATSASSDRMAAAIGRLNAPAARNDLGTPFPCADLPRLPNHKKTQAVQKKRGHADIDGTVLEETAMQIDRGSGVQLVRVMMTWVI